jgi:hypothetical protein
MEVVSAPTIVTLRFPGWMPFSRFCKRVRLFLKNNHVDQHLMLLLLREDAKGVSRHKINNQQMLQETAAAVVLVVIIMYCMMPMLMLEDENVVVSKKSQCTFTNGVTKCRDVCDLCPLWTSPFLSRRFAVLLFVHYGKMVAASSDAAFDDHVQAWSKGSSEFSKRTMNLQARVSTIRVRSRVEEDHVYKKIRNYFDEFLSIENYT